MEYNAKIWDMRNNNISYMWSCVKIFDTFEDDLNERESEFMDWKNLMIKFLCFFKNFGGEIERIWDKSK